MNFVHCEHSYLSDIFEELKDWLMTDVQDVFRQQPQLLDICLALQYMLVEIRRFVVYVTLNISQFGLSVTQKNLEPLNSSQQQQSSE